MPTVDPPLDSTTDSDGSATGALTLDVDPQILEALRSKDRIYVLKLGESFESLINEHRQRVELTPATSYQRLLVHRCSAYYKLSPENDPLTKGTIFVLTTQDSRIPDRRICELVPAESAAQPAFKIMRRSAQERRKPQSHSGSVAGDDLELSDVEASESGSLGGRISTPNSKKQPKTIEEREAAYNEARSRIFMDFQEKAKDKDTSASSSTLSLDGSASTSAGGRSSIGDTDDTASSPTTESEWSVPSASNSRDKKDGRRGGPPSASASSSRSLRAGGSFHTNGSGSSSRNSRAPSPSFSYASLHDPTGQIYDPHAPSQGYYPPQYAYPPYSPPGQAPTPPYLVPYPYYPQHYNPYQPPPVPQHSPADGSALPSSEPYPPVHYQHQYGWAPHSNQQPLQSPPHSIHMSPPPQQQSQQHAHAMGPPFPQHPPQYQPLPPHAHGYGYPLNGYYPPPPPPPPQGPQMSAPPVPHMNMPPPLPQQQQTHPNSNYDLSRPLNGNQIGHPANYHFNNQNNNVTHSHHHNGPRNALGNGVLPNHNARATSRNHGGPGSNSQQSNGIIGNGYGVTGGRNRVSVPNPGRSPWSYGPGVGGNGYSLPMGSHVGDPVGPRFNSNRRTSGNSSSGGNSRSSSNWDEVSSASSTTSSSSRRTYTSTTSSQHPLPPRPDWAVGLKAQPTLAATGGRAHLSDHSLTNSRTMSPISPPRSNSNGQNSPMSPNTSSSSSSQHNMSQTMVSLQSTDFPPLTSSSEKRGPVVTGAWGNSRPVLSPANGNINSSPGNVVATQSPIARQDENERGVFERPSPKVGDPFSPKIVRRPVAHNSPVHHHQRPQLQQVERTSITKGELVVVGPTAAMTLGGQVPAISLGVEEELNGGVEQQPSYTTGVSGAEESVSPSAVVVAPSPSM